MRINLSILLLGTSFLISRSSAANTEFISYPEALCMDCPDSGVIAETLPLQQPKNYVPYSVEKFPRGAGWLSFVRNNAQGFDTICPAVLVKPDLIVIAASCVMVEINNSADQNGRLFPVDIYTSARFKIGLGTQQLSSPIKDYLVAAKYASAEPGYNYLNVMLVQLKYPIGNVTGIAEIKKLKKIKQTVDGVGFVKNAANHNQNLSEAQLLEKYARFCCAISGANSKYITSNCPKGEGYIGGAMFNKAQQIIGFNLGNGKAAKTDIMLEAIAYAEDAFSSKEYEEQAEPIMPDPWNLTTSSTVCRLRAKL